MPEIDLGARLAEALTASWPVAVTLVGVWIDARRPVKDALSTYANLRADELEARRETAQQAGRLRESVSKLTAALTRMHPIPPGGLN